MGKNGLKLIINLGREYKFDSNDVPLSDVSETALSVLIL
jgi:hypothetical protein